MPVIFNHAIFEKDFPLEGVHLVAASAGTGKTYNIQNIYGRLIMEKGFRVSEIQVMTYTEAATAELRDRLRTLLKDLQARLAPELHDCEGKDEKDQRARNDRADSLIQCAPDRDFARNQVELALLDFDSATISTIHGFCSRALNRYAFETRMGFHPDIQDNKDEVLNQRAQDWWRTNRDSFPESLKPQLKLGILQSLVRQLAQKTDWILKDATPDTPAGFLLPHAKAIMEEYENDRVNREQQTFDDILRSMREALKPENGGETFAQRLRQECKAALIDEFQDTDPVQYEIFQRAFLSDKAFPIFFVGDPKQAIYCFRGGDIFTYRRAVEHDIPTDRVYYLDTNYRTTPRLMDAINGIFEDRKNSDGETIYTFGDKSIPYAEKIRSEGPAPLSTLPPFRFIETQKTNDALLAEIHRALRDYPSLRLKDLAILVNFNSYGTELMYLLRQNGIPCVIKRAGNVFTSGKPLAYGKSPSPSLFSRQLHALLSAIDSDGTQELIRAALLTPFFGYTPSELLSMDEAELADWIGKFKELNHLWYSHGFAAMLNLLEAFGTREGLTPKQRIAALPRGERDLADYQQILELAFKVIKERGTAPKTLLHWLETRLVSLADEKESDELTRELESEGDSVKIMTIHAAKGLEFPIVFLPECNLSPSQRDPLAAYHDPQEDFKLTYSLDPNPMQNQEEREEKTRLLYVAMTRATQRTVVFYKDKALKETLAQLINNARGLPNEPSIHWETWEEQLDDPAEQQPYSPQTDTFPLLPSQPPFPFSSRASKGSYSALSPAAHANANDEARDTDSNFGWNAHRAFSNQEPIFHIQGGTAIGSCWHDILEQISFQDTEEQIRPVAARTLQLYGFNPEAKVAEETPVSYLEATVQMICKTLDRPLLSPDGVSFSLRDIKAEERLSEQEFNFASCNAKENTAAIRELLQRHWQNDDSKRPFLAAMRNWEKPIPNGYLNGFIDLIFRHRDFYYIVDWKSNILGGKRAAFTEEALRTEMATAGYFFQYLLYATVLHRFLKETLGTEYDYERNFGGIRYCFLRGLAVDADAAVFSDRPSAPLLEELASSLGIK